MSRAHPWRSKPTLEEKELLMEALNARLYLVKVKGPTQFILQDENSKNYRVSIGSTHLCTCTGFRAKSLPTICIHLFFVMCKILRCEDDDPIIWQYALVESEISKLVSQRHKHLQEQRNRSQQRSNHTHANDPTSSSNPNFPTESSITDVESKPRRIQQKAIEEEDVCAICYDSLMSIPTSTVTQPIDINDSSILQYSLKFCEYGCGQSFHVKCLRIWTQHCLNDKSNTASEANHVTCPMCRHKWTSLKSDSELSREFREAEHQLTEALRNRAPATSNSADNHNANQKCVASSNCCQCSHRITSTLHRYQCVFCSFNLCQICFQSYSNTSNPFLVSSFTLESRQPAASLTSSNSQAPFVHRHVFLMQPAIDPKKSSSNSNHSEPDWCVPGSFSRTLRSMSVLNNVSNQNFGSLQYREISENDYEMLMQLDQNASSRGIATDSKFLPLYLSYCLPTLSEGSCSTNACVFCQQQTLCESDRLLTCLHFAHRQCLYSVFVGDLDTAECAKCGCLLLEGMKYERRYSNIAKGKEKGNARTRKSSSKSISPGDGDSSLELDILGVNAFRGEEKEERRPFNGNNHANRHSLSIGTIVHSHPHLHHMHHNLPQRDHMRRTRKHLQPSHSDSDTLAALLQIQVLTDPLPPRQYVYPRSHAEESKVNNINDNDNNNYNQHHSFSSPSTASTTPIYSLSTSTTPFIPFAAEAKKPIGRIRRGLAWSAAKNMHY